MGLIVGLWHLALWIGWPLAVGAWVLGALLLLALALLGERGSSVGWASDGLRRSRREAL